MQPNREQWSRRSLTLGLTLRLRYLAPDSGNASDGPTPKLTSCPKVFRKNEHPRTLRTIAQIHASSHWRDGLSTSYYSFQITGLDRYC